MDRIDSIDGVVCAIVRNACWGEGLPWNLDRLPDGIGWADIRRELQVQALSGLIPGAKAALGFDEGDIEQERLIDLRRRVLALHLLDIQESTVSLLRDADIPVVVLKGSAAAALYPDPLSRVFGDVDVLVHPDDYIRARDLLLDAGFAIASEEDISDHHIGLSYKSVMVELHWAPNGVPNNPNGKTLCERILASAANAATLAFEGYSFPVLEPAYNGAVLLLHACQHLGTSGLGFRQIIDWMMYVYVHLGDERWPEFERLLGDESLCRTARCLTRFCQIYLGLPEEGFKWCGDADEEVCSALLEHIMLLGNFGSKVAVKTGSVSLTSARGPLGFARYLQSAGKIHHKLIRDHRLLHPFAWVFQLCRCGRIIATRSNPFASIRYDMKETRRRRALADAMGLLDD